MDAQEGLSKFQQLQVKEISNQVILGLKDTFISKSIFKETIRYGGIIIGICLLLSLHANGIELPFLGKILSKYLTGI